MAAPHPNGSVPTIERITGALGLVITLALFAFIAWQALQPSDEVPSIAVEVERIEPAAGGFVVKFAARNRTSRAAAAVEVEGTLRRGDAEPLTSTATLDYVPGDLARRGGLFFPADPRTGQLELRALGFSEP